MRPQYSLSGDAAVLRDTLVDLNHAHRPCPRWLRGWATQPDGSLRRDHLGTTATVSRSGDSYEIVVEGPKGRVVVRNDNARSALRQAGTIAVLNANDER